MNDTFWVLLVGFLVVSFLVVPVLRRLRSARYGEATRRLGDDASAHGLRYEDASGAGASSPTGGGHVFSGTSSGLAWTATVEKRLEGEARPRNVEVQRTRFSFTALSSAPGTFVLAIALPPGVKAPPAPPAGATGLIASLAARASEALLDLYVTGYFGAEYRALVNVAVAARPDGPGDLLLLATDGALAARLLDAEGLALLASLRQVDAGGKHPLADGFGLLASPQGLLVGVQVGLIDPAMARAVAESIAPVVARAAGTRRRG